MMELKMKWCTETFQFCRHSNRLVCPSQRPRLGGHSKAPCPGKMIEVRKRRLVVVQCASVTVVGAFLLAVQPSGAEVVCSGV